MKNYIFKDGYTHVSDNGLTAKEIKADESAHGDLLLIKLNGCQTISVFYPREIKRNEKC